MHKSSYYCKQRRYIFFILQPIRFGLLEFATKEKKIQVSINYILIDIPNMEKTFYWDTLYVNQRFVKEKDLYNHFFCQLAELVSDFLSLALVSD